MLTDEQIFDIIDGCASAEILQRHHILMKESVEYKAYFQEIESLHLDLSSLSLEKPSAQFTENILANVAYSPVKKKSWSSQLTFIFLAFMSLFFVVLIGLMVFYFSNSTSAIEIPRVENLEVINTFQTDGLVKIIVLVNLVILLAIFDRKFLKPYFMNKKMRLG